MASFPQARTSHEKRKKQHMKDAEICRGRIVTKYLRTNLSRIWTVVGTAYNGKYSVLRAVVLCDQTVVAPQSSEDLSS